MFAECRMKAVDLAEAPTILLLHRIEQKVSIDQRITVDPIECGDAGDGEEFSIAVSPSTA